MNFENINPTAESVRKLTKILGRIDGSTGNVSINNKTGTSVPQLSTNVSPVLMNDDWIRYLDQKSNRFYFYNTKSKLTQWNDPSIVSENKNANESEDQIIKDVLGNIVSKISGLDNQVAENSDNPVSNFWVQYFDPKSNRIYYYNTNTKATQWDPPADSIFPSQVSNVKGYAANSLFPSRSGSSVTSDEYRFMASFNQHSGRFSAASMGPEEHGLSYWDKVGRPEDKAGRQLSAFIDLKDLERNRQEHAAKRQQPQFQKSAYKAWKQRNEGIDYKMLAKKRKQGWLYED